MKQIKVKNFVIINEKGNGYSTLKQAITLNFDDYYGREMEGFSFDYNGNYYNFQDTDMAYNIERAKFIYNPIILKIFNELKCIYDKVADLYTKNKFTWNSEWEKYFDEFKEKWVENDETN